MKEIIVNVDNYNENSIKTIEGDNLSEVYKIYICKNKRRVNLTNKIAVMAYVDEYNSKRSNILNLNITNAAEGEIELPITNIISEHNGIYACQVAIYGENNSLEQTAPFSLIVENNIFSKISNSAINSSDFHILSEAIKTTNAYGEKLKEGTENIELQYAENLNKKADEIDLIVERKRIDLLTKMENGETEGNSELLDIRIGADGKEYNTAGNAIREQFKDNENIFLEIKKALDKGIFDIKNMYEWEAGYINSNGEYINLNYMKRVTKPKFIPYDTVDVTMNGENYNLHVIEYNAEGVFVKSTDYINKDRFTIDIAEDHKYAFCLQYRRNNEFIADLSTLTLTCNVGMNFKIVKNTNKLESVNIKEKIHFNIGVAASSNMGNAICKYTLNKDNSYSLNMISGNNETYSLYNFALEKAYIDINKKKYLIEIKNNSTEPIDFSNIKNRFTLSNRKDFSGTVFHLKDLMTDTVLQPNSSKKILLDMNSEVIKEAFKDTSDVLYFVFGYYSALQSDRDFKLSFIDFTEYERKGVVVADYLSDFDLNDYNVFKLNIENDLETIKKVINTDCKIVCYGDSLTMGAGWEDHSPDGIQRGYPEFIQEFSGITTINTGIGGDKCNDIFARLGSEPVVINNITIPASKTPVELGYPLTTILGRQFKSDIYNKHDKPYKINPVIINGVIGTLTQPIFQGSYYFTRKEVGEEVIVNRPTLLTTGQMIKLRNPNDIHIFYVGQNGGYENIDDWIQQLRNAIDYIGCDKYLIIACQTNLHNSTWDNIYDRFKKEFRGKFVDIRKYMLEYGLEDCKISPTPQDLEDISKGVCPTSLKKQGDKVHFNYYGYKVIGKLLYNRLKELYPNYIK